VHTIEKTADITFTHAGVLRLYALKFKVFKWHQISLITKNTEAN